MNNNDTIAAMATPLGEGAIGIIRISGSEVLTIAQKIFRKPLSNQETTLKPLKNFRSHYLNYGYLIDSQTKDVIDEVLLCFMKSPHTYTREDMIEIYGHGSVVTLTNILGVIFKEGARLAEPGEFTKRAFLNGRLDLTQAEAVVDIIRAKTKIASQIALKQLKGELSKFIKRIQNKLVDLLTIIEANINFPDELEAINPEINSGDILYKDIKNIRTEIKTALLSSERGKGAREGLKGVIIGRPNVGKSSLLNALLQEERVIVSPIPGTTRDTIEEVINIDGILLKVVDTAGLQDTNDEIGLKGVKRTYKSIKEADIILFMISQPELLTQQDIQIINKIKTKRTLLIINKIDLNPRINLGVFSHNKSLNQIPKVKVSALYNIGVDKLKKEILKIVRNNGTTTEDSFIISNIRHIHSLGRTEEHLKNAMKALKNNLPFDLISTDLRLAISSLGEITGNCLTEEIIDNIFNKFCLGK